MQRTGRFSVIRMARTILVVVTVGSAALLSACGRSPADPPAAPGPLAAGTIDRTVLPIADPEYPAITEVDARKATAPPRFEVKAPRG